MKTVSAVNNTDDSKTMLCSAVRIRWRFFILAYFRFVFRFVLFRFVSARVGRILRRAAIVYSFSGHPRERAPAAAARSFSSLPLPRRGAGFRCARYSVVVLIILYYCYCHYHRCDCCTTTTTRKKKMHRKTI